jgi:hypothetical protein
LSNQIKTIVEQTIVEHPTSAKHHLHPSCLPGSHRCQQGDNVVSVPQSGKSRVEKGLMETRVFREKNMSIEDILLGCIKASVILLEI